MRKRFAKLLYDAMGLDSRIVLLTGDLGYGLWDNIRKDYPDRFYNVGSSEQLMLGMAAGMALEGKIPFVYSITPFAIYRPFEFIRNYLHKDQIPVKILGGGRDKEYGSLGFSHWAEEDADVLKCLDLYKSWPQEDELEEELQICLTNNLPCYINLSK